MVKLVHTFEVVEIKKKNAKPEFTGRVVAAKVASRLKFHIASPTIRGLVSSFQE